MKIQGYMQWPEEYPVVAEFTIPFPYGTESKVEVPVSIVKRESTEHKIVDNKTRAPLVTFKTGKRKPEAIIIAAKAAYDERLNSFDEPRKITERRFYDRLMEEKAPNWV